MDDRSPQDPYSIQTHRHAEAQTRQTQDPNSGPYRFRPPTPHPVLSSTQPPPARRAGAANPRRGRVIDDLDLAPAGERRLGRRRAAEEIVRRARLLHPDERAVIEAVYGEGRSFAELGRLAGVRAESLRCRARRALRRADTDLFRFVAQHHGAWPPHTRRVARLWVLHGLSLRKIAERLAVSLHVVRTHANAVRALHAAARTNAPDSGASRGEVSE